MNVGPVELTVEDAKGLAAFALLLAFVGTVTALVFSRLGHVGPRRDPMAFLHHLEELRLRVLRVGILLAMWCVLFLSVRAEPLRIHGVPLARPELSLFDNVGAQVYRAIAAAAVPDGVQLIVTSPTEAVAAQMEVALLLALVITFPFLLYELWAFFSPGLRSTEQRFVSRAFPAALVLFFFGIGFGFRFVVPLLFAVLYGFATPLGAVPFLSAGALVGTIATMCLLFGAAFELPLVMAALVRLGLTTPETYTRKWRHAVLAILIIAGVTTDPTLTSQLIVAGLLLVLYFGGVVASHLVQRDARAAVWRPYSKAT